MIAYHYPPFKGGSGIHRALRFSQYLPECGWEPIVLSAHPRAFSARGDDQLGEVPESVVVKRAFALDAARHFAIRGAYPGFLALPDRWWSWWLGAIPAGLAMIRKFEPTLIWSTYPIATAHCIGHTLSRITGLPWVADFRDSMTEDNYPTDPVTRRVFRRIEAATIHRCTRAAFTTPGTIRMYSERYPSIPDERFCLIANGYDEGTFELAERQRGMAVRQTGRRLRLLHSGVIYPEERNPTAFFAALAELKQEGRLKAEAVEIVLRATGHDEYLTQLIGRFDIADLVTLAGAIPYADAVAEMLEVDGLLVLQAASCNHQIPAKVYEYLRAGRPIVGLTDPSGDTAEVLRQAGVRIIVPLDNKDEIKCALLDYLEDCASGAPGGPAHSAAQLHSRRARTLELARLFDTLTATRS
jgi:glycosyltransferase involved in cell wall biosynthesis